MKPARISGHLPLGPDPNPSLHGKAAVSLHSEQHKQRRKGKLEKKLLTLDSKCLRGSGEDIMFVEGINPPLVLLHMRTLSPLLPPPSWITQNDSE